MFFTLGMWMFLTAMERSMNACDLPPAAETVVAVTRAVTLDEESSRGLHGLKTEARTRPVPEIV